LTSPIIFPILQDLIFIHLYITNCGFLGGSRQQALRLFNSFQCLFKDLYHLFWSDAIRISRAYWKEGFLKFPDEGLEIVPVRCDLW
jgi:hypothetical protein